MTRKSDVDIPVPDELAEAIRRAAARLPEHPHDPARAYRRHRARRWRVVAGSAAVACAVTAVVAVPVLLLRPAPDSVAQPDRVGQTQTEPAPPAPPTTAPATVDAHAADRPDFSFTIATGPLANTGPLAGYQIVTREVMPDYQTAAILAVGGTDPVAYLSLYRPSELPIPMLPDGVGPTVPPTAQVHGQPAFVAVDGSKRIVQWEYAPASLAMLNGDIETLSEPTLLALAEAVRFVDPYPARVPFRLDYVPADLPADTVWTDHAKPAAVVLFRQHGDQHVVFLNLTIPAAWPPEAQAWDWQPATLAGRPGQCTELDYGRRCEVTYDGIAVGIDGSLSAAEFERIVAGLHLADLADPTTWYDIDEAIPGL